MLKASLFHYIQCRHNNTCPFVNHQNEAYSRLILIFFLHIVRTFCLWKLLLILAHSCTLSSSKCLLRTMEVWLWQKNPQWQREDKQGDRESQMSSEREREICLLCLCELWPAGGWRLKIPRPEPAMIWADLSINLRAFRSALVRLSNSVWGEMAVWR